MYIIDIKMFLQQCHNNHIMESAKMSVNKCMDADNVVCIHSGILFSH